MTKKTAVLCALLVLSACFLVYHNRQVQSQRVTYTNPSPYHNFDYHYDYEYNFSSPLSPGYQFMPQIGKNIVLAAIVPDVEQTAYRQFVAGLQQETTKNKVGLIVHSLAEGTSLQALTADIIRENIDGVILYLSGDADAYAEVRRLKQANIPVVTVWSSIDQRCLDMVDTFVGYDEEEFGLQLAHWITQWDNQWDNQWDDQKGDTADPSILLIADENERTVAQACRNKLIQTMPENQVLVAQWPLDGAGLPSASENLMIVNLLPSITPELEAVFPDWPHPVLAVGESEEIRELGNRGHIDGGCGYSRLSDGELAALACIQTVSGVKCPVRLQSQLEMNDYARH